MECAGCHVDLSPLRRGNQQYCSSRCRTAAHRALPAETLRRLPRWVRRNADKIPLTITGTPASSTRQSTWSTFEAASESSVGAGLGFVLNGDGIVCVDLDHCLDSRGHIAKWAADLVATMPATYVEVSPSGDGLHVWGFGTIDKGRRSNGVEVYGTGRYITVTGRRWRGSVSSFADLTDWLDCLDV